MPMWVVPMWVVPMWAVRMWAVRMWAVRMWAVPMPEEISVAMDVVNDGGVLLVRFKEAALDVVIRRGSGRRG